MIRETIPEWTVTSRYEKRTLPFTTYGWGGLLSPFFTLNDLGFLLDNQKQTELRRSPLRKKYGRWGYSFVKGP